MNAHAYLGYCGLHSQSRVMLNNAAELSFLATGKKERFYSIDDYFGTARIEFADGTAFEVFVQELSERGGDYHPAYLALRNSQGKVIPSSLWPRDQIELCEGDFTLFSQPLELQYA